MLWNQFLGCKRSNRLWVRGQLDMSCTGGKVATVRTRAVLTTHYKVLRSVTAMSYDDAPVCGHGLNN